MAQELNIDTERGSFDESFERLTADESMSSAHGAELVGRYATGRIFDKTLETERKKLRELEENGASEQEITAVRHYIAVLQNLALETDAVHQNIVDGGEGNE